MRHYFGTLLKTILFGPHARGLEVWQNILQLGPRGTCAYCQGDRTLVEVRGPLGTGGVFVCEQCATSCLSITH